MPRTTDLWKYSSFPDYPLPFVQQPLEFAVPQVTDEEARRLRDLIEQAGKQPPTATPTPAQPANDRQIGGNHYRAAAAANGEQHWDRMWRLYREAWFVGNITKYLERHRHKDGLQDEHNARHYPDEHIEPQAAAAQEWQRKAAQALPPLPNALPAGGVG